MPSVLEYAGRCQDSLSVCQTVDRAPHTQLHYQQLLHDVVLSETEHLVDLASQGTACTGGQCIWCAGSPYTSEGQTDHQHQQQ